MKKIAVLGANGQVGLEVCIHLSLMGMDVLAVCRNDLARSIFIRLKIESIAIDYLDSIQLKELLKDFDVVADFILPGGDFNNIKTSYHETISNVISCIPKTCTYVFMSSQIVFGVSETRPVFKWYWIPGSVYCKSKRYAEKTVVALSKKHNKKYFIFRLGQVQGIIQGVTNSWYHALKDAKVIIKIPETNAYIIWCYGIAKALKNIAKHCNEAPGIYSVVSQPEWTWKQLFEYIAERELVTKFIHSETSFKQKVISLFLKPMKGLVLKNKEVIATNIVSLFPEYYSKLRYKNYIANAVSEINSLNKSNELPNVFFTGSLPGNRLQCVEHSEDELRLNNHKCLELLEQIIPSKPKRS